MNNQYLSYIRKIGNKIFTVEIRLSKKKDKIVIYLYDNQNKFLGVIGELQYSGRLKYRSYYYNIKKIEKEFNISSEEIIYEINNIIKEHHDKILEHYSEFFEQEEDILDIWTKISKVEDELISWLRENNKEFIPENVLKAILKKYKLDIRDFIMYTRSFYEKEPKKWYPLA